MRIDAILSTNVLSQNHALQPSALIETVICLNQLNLAAMKIGKRISFTDDVRIFYGVKDITDAVKEYRDAVCHIHANAHFISPDGSPKQRNHRQKNGENYTQISFTVIFGKGIIMQAPQYTIGSEYEDDVCFIFGAHRLYLRRHLMRNFQEVKVALMPNFPNLL